MQKKLHVIMFTIFIEHDKQWNCSCTCAMMSKPIRTLEWNAGCTVTLILYILFCGCQMQCTCTCTASCTAIGQGSTFTCTVHEDNLRKYIVICFRCLSLYPSNNNIFLMIFPP